jgi:hypothetical protein
MRGGRGESGSMSLRKIFGVMCGGLVKCEGGGGLCECEWRPIYSRVVWWRSVDSKCDGGMVPSASMLE